MIPVEIGEPSARRAYFEETLNNESLAFQLDMIDEVIEHAQIQEETCNRKAGHGNGKNKLNI